jgi:MFS family permease
MVDAVAARAYAILARAAVWRITSGRQFPYEDRFMGERIRPAAEARPTWVRWRVVALLMLFVGMAHFNRICITVAGTERILQPAIDLPQPALGASTVGVAAAPYGIGPLLTVPALLPPVTEKQMGWVYSAFLFVYTLCMLPGGWLIDRRGPRFALLVVGFGSAVFAALTGFSALALGVGLPLIVTWLVVRGLMGACSAPLHPGAARAVSLWLPRPQHALGNGLVTGAALAGIALTPWVFGWLIDHMAWPTAFVLAGAVTALLSCVLALYATDRPGQHRGVNVLERQLIEQGDTEDATAGDGQHAPAGASAVTVGQMVALLRSRSLVLVTVSYGAVSYFQYLIFYWVQYYLIRRLEVTTEVARHYTSLTGVGMMVGMFAGGGLTDWLERYFAHRLARAFVPAVGMVAGAAFLGLASLSRNAEVAETFFVLAMGAVGLGEGAFWATALELGGRRGGVAAAILNTGGNLGGLLAPVVTPQLAEHLGWAGSFAVGAAVPFVGALLWVGVNPAERTGAGTEGALPSREPPASPPTTGPFT